MIRIEPSETDDTRFLDLVMRILDGAIHCYKPVELYVIQIDTWFDHKWDGYSGRIGYCINVWLDPLTPPPVFPRSREKPARLPSQ